MPPQSISSHSSIAPGPSEIAAPTSIGTAVSSNFLPQDSIVAASQPLIVSSTIIEPSSIIATPVLTATVTTATPPSTAHGPNLNAGQLVAVLIAGLFLMSLPAVGFFLYQRREKVRTQAKGANVKKETKTKKGLLPYLSRRLELDGEAIRRHELETKRSNSELDSRSRYELGGNSIHEMRTSNATAKVPWVEMRESPRATIHEMRTSIATTAKERRQTQRDMKHEVRISIPTVKTLRL